MIIKTMASCLKHKQELTTLKLKLIKIINTALRKLPHVNENYVSWEVSVDYSFTYDKECSDYYGNTITVDVSLIDHDANHKTVYIEYDLVLNKISESSRRSGTDKKTYDEVLSIFE